MQERRTPWGALGALAVVLALVGGLGWYLFATPAAPVDPFRPTDANPDPSLAIPGVVTASYVPGRHILPTQRVAYDRQPPFGGPHDSFWSACTGVVYPRAVRTENMVHATEHGAIWIAYDPARVTGPALDALTRRVSGVDSMLMAPYPGLDQPISLQAWGHQLKLSDANDPRIGQFVTALKRNPHTVPEDAASCAALGPGAFDPANPPPFDPPPYPASALPMTWQGTPGAK